jgi:hypothetical protein
VPAILKFEAKLRSQYRAALKALGSGGHRSPRPLGDTAR